MFVERWTIDEIGDGVVRVLAARSLDPNALGLLAERSRTATAPVLAEESGAEVMAVELGTAAPVEASPVVADGVMALSDMALSDMATPEESWTEEQDSVLDAVSLAAFVTLFREQDSGAVERPLRETDVFWVVADDVPVNALSDGRIRRSETDLVLAAYATAAPVVRDMTAPARQASKVLYHDAFRKSEEQT